MTHPRFTEPTFDGDRRLLVDRCQRRGIPAAVVDRHGFLVLVRTRDDLETPNLRSDHE